MRRTKIVATIGPATDSTDALERLLRAGTDVVRLNLSHGPLDTHLDRLRTVREIARRIDRPVGVLADLPGPKIRAGSFPQGGAHLVPGSTVRLKSGDDTSSAETIFVDYPTLTDDLGVGDDVIFGDGAIRLSVVAVDEEAAAAVVETGGLAQGRPGVHIPSERLRVSTPTDADLELAEAVAAAGVDFVAVSFVRFGDDITRVRKVVGQRSEIVAKIETSSALDQLSEILERSDAIMVARGDLGIDLPLEDLPHLQKTIVRRCVEYGIPVIIATQMLESMTSAPLPTRAEVTDVANAVFDGADALMLSGETAIGAHPDVTVKIMGSIAMRAEKEASYRHWAERLGRIQRERWDSVEDRITWSLTHAAQQAAEDVAAAAILCCTVRGRTAKAMARFRPSARLLAFAATEQTVAQLTLSWGVEPLRMSNDGTTDEVVWYAVEKAHRKGLIASGDTVVVLAGSQNRDTVKTAADVLRIVRVG